ncbi:nucleoside hydrolase [Saccharopolyspora phatthalungensis]|uniref:Purine nucleosidase n=1 Tax=Saccharopolyspora phatthalungensis TaxID=664693 RepID=A0A840Q460_9PSEU|nr:nucleoside hydrolase [Saccharopolyspora phatthalungensis]MBB5154421.1 purine nucleosidase [Saccharopolyspora phatthalungensis]
MVKVIFDGDYGIDDALATLFLAGRADVELLAVGTVHGNARADAAAANALQVLDIAGRRDIPVAVGALRPLAQPLEVSALVHGEDGLGGQAHAVPELRREPVSAAEQLVRIVRERPGECTVVATGPLTNLAVALLLEPRLPELVRNVVVMGGTTREPGNISPLAEANIWHDPEAAALVFGAGWSLTLVGLDVTMHTWLDQSDVDRIASAPGRVAEFAHSILRHYLTFYRGRHDRPGCPLHDPSAAVLAVRPDLARYKKVPVQVELRGAQTRGMLVVDRREFSGRDGPLIDVATEIDRDRLVAEFLSGLLGP